MTLTRVPRRRLTPRFTERAIQAERDQPQQRLGRRLNLERAQDRLLGPRAAFLQPPVFSRPRDEIDVRRSLASSIATG